MGVLRDFRVYNCGLFVIARDSDILGVERAGLEREGTNCVNRAESGSTCKLDLVVYTSFWRQKDIKAASWPTALNF